MLSGHQISNELAQAVKNQSPASSLIAENRGHNTKQPPDYKQTFAKLFSFLAALEETFFWCKFDGVIRDLGWGKVIFMAALMILWQNTQLQHSLWVDTGHTDNILSFNTYKHSQGHWCLFMQLKYVVKYQISEKGHWLPTFESQVMKKCSSPDVE